MEDFVEDCNVEIDEEYEFDASQFFDFTRPELDSQIEEERWFQVSGDYPHSPFIVKLDLEQILPAEGVAKSSKSSKFRKSSNSDTSSRHGLPPSKNFAKGRGHPALQEAAKPKAKPLHRLSQPWNPNFMEPTASHLAKQNAVHDKKLSSKLSASYPQMQDNVNQKKIPIASNNLGTKRQKLETGFLNKGSNLKNKFTLSHKSSNMVTVPREPELGTLLRSQRRRSKNSSVSSETQSPKHKSSFKDQHPPNRKLLQTHSLPRPTKSKAQLTEFQEFHFKTSERANHHSSTKGNRPSTRESVLGSPLSEMFSKLSLGSKSKKSSVSERRASANSKGSNRSRSSSSSRGSFQSEFWR